MISGTLELLYSDGETYRKAKYQAERLPLLLLKFQNGELSDRPAESNRYFHIIINKIDSMVWSIHWLYKKSDDHAPYDAKSVTIIHLSI